MNYESAIWQVTLCYKFFVGAAIITYENCIGKLFHLNLCVMIWCEGSATQFWMYLDKSSNLLLIYFLHSSRFHVQFQFVWFLHGKTQMLHGYTSLRTQIAIVNIQNMLYIGGPLQYLLATGVTGCMLSNKRAKVLWTCINYFYIMVVITDKTP